MDMAVIVQQDHKCEELVPFGKGLHWQTYWRTTSPSAWMHVAARLLLPMPFTNCQRKIIVSNTDYHSTFHASVPSISAWAKMTVCPDLRCATVGEPRSQSGGTNDESVLV
jgi:hypothetical protein